MELICRRRLFVPFYSVRRLFVVIALIYIITEFVHLLLSALEVFMLVRAIMSIFPVAEDSPIAAFVFSVTEPVIFPIREIFSRLGLFEGFPIDISFFVAMICLSLIKNLLP